MVAFARSMMMPASEVGPAITMARTEASRRVRLGHFAATDREDGIQDLLFGIVARWPRFDSGRAGFSTFFSLVVRHEASSLVRANGAAKRGGGRTLVSLDQRLAAGDFFPVCDSTDTDPARFDLRNDVRAVVGSLPPNLRRLARALMTKSPTAAARSLKIPRHVALAQVKQIRERFEAAGLRP